MFVRQTILQLRHESLMNSSSVPGFLTLPMVFPQSGHRPLWVLYVTNSAKSPMKNMKATDALLAELSVAADFEKWNAEKKDIAARPRINAPMTAVDFRWVG
ncbi:MAG: hypothetical protein WAZ48_09410 [Lysobacteraceae bacterium]